MTLYMYVYIYIFTDEIWYMAKGHPKIGWAPIGFAVAALRPIFPQSHSLGF